MISASFHEKNSPNTVLCFDGDFSEASLVGNSCVGTERIVSLLKLQGLEEYEGSLSVASVNLLSEERPFIKVIDTDLPLRKGIENNNYALNAAIDRFLNESNVGHAIAYRFKTIIDMVYADLQEKPLYLLLDLNGSRPEEQYLVTEFVALVFSLNRILIHAPAISMKIKGDLIPLSKLVRGAELPKEPVLDFEQTTANEKGEVKTAPSVEPEPEKKVEETQPKQEQHFVEVPANFGQPVEEKPINFFGKVLYTLRHLSPKTIDLILNILFATLFSGLAIAVCPINFVFSQEGSNTMLIVCVIVCYVFMIMAQVPIVSVYQADKEEMNPFKVKPFLFTGIAFSLLGIVAGIILFSVGRSKGWDSHQGIVFYIAYFLYPVFLAAYTAWAFFRKTRQKQK